MSTLSLQVESAGYDFGNSARILVGGTDVGAGRYARGLNVAVVDEVSGKVGGFFTYDTNGDRSASDAFAAAIEALPVGMLVAVAVKDDAQKRLTDRARRALQTLGSALIWNLEYRASFALIGQKGAAPGSRPEGESPVGAITRAADLPLQPAADNGLRITVESAGHDFGDSAAILVDQTPVSIHGGYGRGLNVVAFDSATGGVLRTGTFDTHAGPVASDDFADFIGGLDPLVVVAVAVRDEAVKYLTDRAIAACESIGSDSIRDLAYRGSWAIVGTVGALPGEAAESLSNSAAARACSWLFPVGTEPTRFLVTARSQGKDAGSAAAIYVNSIPVMEGDATGRGLNVVAIDADTAFVQATAHFDTHGDASAADAFVSFVTALAPGTVVAVAVSDSATQQLDDRARRALGWIGSGLAYQIEEHASYAIVGRKGAAPGSVAELLDDTAAATASLTVLLSPGICRSFHSVEVRSAGHDVGDYAAFFIDGVSQPLVSGSDRGLNVMVFDAMGCVTKTRVFDTHADPTASDIFAELVEAAPDGQMIAIGVKDEAQKYLNERAILACEALGSVLIRDLAYRGSWALIGRKGAVAGSVAEALGNDRPAWCTDMIPCADLLPAGFYLEARSVSGPWDSKIVKDGDRMRFLIREPSILAAAFDPTTGELKWSGAFDAWTPFDLALWIEGTDTGAVVACAICGDAAVLLNDDRTRRAVETLGSACVWEVGGNDTWAMVGVKGAAAGSASELRDGAAIVAAQLWVPLFALSGTPADGIRASAAAEPLPIAPLLILIGVGVAQLFIYLVISQSLVPAPTPPMAVPEAPATRRRAVFVGVDYIDFEGIASLSLGGLAADLTYKLQSALVNAGLCTPSATLWLAEQRGPGVAIPGPNGAPTRQNVMKALSWLIDGASAGDVLYFHFIGHGHSANPMYGVSLLTLSEDLHFTDPLYASDFQAAIADLPAGVNLTCTFHSCFSGGMIDGSNTGRGIGLSATDDTTVAHLSRTGNTYEGVICVYVKRATREKNRQPFPTYAELRRYIADVLPHDTPTLTANPTLYDVNTLKFLQPIPVGVERPATDPFVF